MSQEHILFLTGKLAEKALYKILAAMQPTPFTYTIKQMNVNVAALMTTVIIQKRLMPEEIKGVSRIILPGRCKVDLTFLSDFFGVPVELGPEELKDLPQFFNQKKIISSLNQYDICILAEIYSAPQKSTQELLAIAQAYKNAGADVIDIGCLPETPFPHLEEVVNILTEQNYQVSVDSLNPDELLRAANAGAKYLLSLTEKTLWVAEKTDAIPIIIPQEAGDMPSLKRSIAHMQNLKKPFIADPILNPINCGFMQSLHYYYELRKEFPEIPLLMGTGNVTELMDVDTLGVNALLIAMASELQITHVLTSQLNPHTRTTIKEMDAARRLMFAAKEYATLPQGFGDHLLALHGKNPFPYDKTEIETLAAAIKDPSYRIQISAEGIHLFNRDGLHTATDPFALFPYLDLKGDLSHAFYLGVEMANAQIAWKLGKRYSQDQELSWGCAVDGLTQDS